MEHLLSFSRTPPVPYPLSSKAHLPFRVRGYHKKKKGWPLINEVPSTQFVWRVMRMIKSILENSDKLTSNPGKLQMFEGEGEHNFIFKLLSFPC